MDGMGDGTGTLTGMGRAVDYALWPILFVGPVVAVVLLLDRGAGDVVATVAPTAALGLVAWLLERLRPEHPDHTRPDFPLWMEAGHFLFGVELGYFVALGICTGIHRFVSLALWPESWPIAAQIFAAVLLYEGASYWQHRWFHRSRRLWGFHAVHHTGSRLNVFRSLRFHAVDIAVPTLMGYLPLVVLNAPTRMLTILGVIISALGILQHANVRMRTPRWLDALVCTPVLHRQHHALDRRVSECNYGTTVMLWDQVFGTYRAALRPDGPAEIGIEDDATPTTFLGQVLGPFERS